MPTVNVLMLGPAADLVGQESAAITLADGATLATLIQELGNRFPRLAGGLGCDTSGSGGTIRCAVNQSFAGLDHVLHDGDEVAVIPPVSGGAGDENADHIALIGEPIDAAKVRSMVGGDEQAGAIAVFEGTTRRQVHPDHGQLVELSYEAYDEMAITQMQRLVAIARDRWPILRTVIIHRIGRVPLTESSVAIAVACPHRAEAFEACRSLIDMLKKEVPIWKKEIWADGCETWVDPTKQQQVRSEK